MRCPPRRLRSAHGNDRPPSAPRSPVHAGGDADRRISSNVGGPAAPDVPPPRAMPHRVRARAGPPARSLQAGARRGPDTARRCAADRAWATIFQQPVYSVGALARADRGSVCNGIAAGREEFLRGDPAHVEARGSGKPGKRAVNADGPDGAVSRQRVARSSRTTASRS